MNELVQILVAGVVHGAIYGLVGLGIVLVYKASNVLNLAQPELGTFAVFIAWQLVQWGLPWAAGAAAGIVVALVLSLTFERFVVSRMTDAPRLTVTVATVGVTLLLFSLEALLWPGEAKFLPGPIERGYEIGTTNAVIRWTELIAIGAVATLGLGLNAFLRRTDFGLGVVAAAQDPVAVRLVGVRLSRVSMFTWGSAGILAAVAALLIEPTFRTFYPGFMVGLVFVPSLAAALFGGLRSLSGTFLGGLVVGIIDQAVTRQFVASTIPGMPFVVIFAVILALMLFRPQGLFVRARA